MREKGANATDRTRSVSRVRIVLSASVMLFSLLLSGCETVAFYGQALQGHWQILSARQPIAELLSEASLDEGQAAKLRLILQLREFAGQELTLPVGDNYLDYTDLQRPFAVWNVFAAPALAIQPLTWCYPVAGCVSYRGYFDEKKAQQKAATLASDGYDVYVGGVAAYSTLGWLDDVVLNTFIQRSDTQLAVLIIHELAHQQLYISGDTTFNESFARAVEIEGVKRWLEKKGDTAAFRQYLYEQRRHTAWVELLASYRAKLDEVYRSPRTDQQKLNDKQIVLNELQSSYKTFKQRWQNYSGYDLWMSDSLNNAKLATVADYNNWVPAFRQLMQDEQQDWQAFYKRCETLSRLEKTDREAQLAALNEKFASSKQAQELAWQNNSL